MNLSTKGINTKDKHAFFFNFRNNFIESDETSKLAAAFRKYRRKINKEQEIFSPPQCSSIKNQAKLERSIFLDEDNRNSWNDLEGGARWESVGRFPRSNRGQKRRFPRFREPASY